MTCLHQILNTLEVFLLILKFPRKGNQGRGPLAGEGSSTKKKEEKKRQFARTVRKPALGSQLIRSGDLKELKRERGEKNGIGSAREKHREGGCMRGK